MTRSRLLTWRENSEYGEGTGPPSSRLRVYPSCIEVPHCTPPNSQEAAISLSLKLKLIWDENKQYTKGLIICLPDAGGEENMGVTVCLTIAVF